LVAVPPPPPPPPPLEVFGRPLQEARKQSPSKRTQSESWLRFIRDFIGPPRQMMKLAAHRNETLENPQE
jgi:hypothetical protein